MLSDDFLRSIDSEVEKQVNDKVTVILGDIAKRWSLPLDALLRDIPSISTDTLNRGQCRGVQKNNKRCTRRGKNGGYCGFHLYQKRALCPVVVESRFQHTHDMSIPFMENCPACIAIKNITPPQHSTDRNELIDLDNIL